MFGRSNRKAAEKQLQLILKYQKVFDGEDGKAVLEDLCKRAYMLDSTFDANPNRMAFNEGQRAIIIDIFKTLNIDFVKFKEAIESEFSNEE